MQFHLEKTNKQKSHKILFESLSKITWKYMELKYLDQLRKNNTAAKRTAHEHKI